jgi:hypothetical protein
MSTLEQVLPGYPMTTTIVPDGAAIAVLDADAELLLRVSTPAAGVYSTPSSTDAYSPPTVGCLPERGLADAVSEEG